MTHRLVALLLSASSLVACADKPPATPWDPRPEARDELLFALPRWCGKNAPRRPWTEWAMERDRPQSQQGICGIRTPEETDAEGLCVEIEDGVIRRASLRKPGPPVPLEGLAGHAPGTWLQASAGDQSLQVKIEGAAIEMATPEGSIRGPCFWR